MCCVCFAASTRHKKHRRGRKRDSVSSVPEERTNLGFRSKGSFGNRSAENILRQTEAESVGVAPDELASEDVEVTFEIRKKYDVKEFSYFCVENEKRSIRRVKSNDSLLTQHKIVVRQPTGSTSARDKSQTFPKNMSGSRETLEDYASSGDVTTSEDGRNGSCASSVLDSET